MINQPTHPDMKIVSKLKEFFSSISEEGKKANTDNISQEYHKQAKEQIQHIEHDITRDNYEYLLHGKPLVEMPIRAISDGEKIRYCMHGSGLKTENNSYKTSSGDMMYLVVTDSRIILRANNMLGESANESISHGDVKGIGYNSYFSKGMKQHKITITTINRQFEFSTSDANHGENDCADLVEFLRETKEK